MVIVRLGVVGALWLRRWALSGGRWGAESEDLRDGLSGLPLLRMIGVLGVLGSTLGLGGPLPEPEPTVGDWRDGNGMALGSMGGRSSLSFTAAGEPPLGPSDEETLMRCEAI